MRIGWLAYFPLSESLDIPLYIRFAPVAVKTYPGIVTIQASNVPSATVILNVTGYGVNATGLGDDSFLRKISCFPNPAGSSLHITNCSSFENIRIISLSGTVMLCRCITQENELTIDTDSLSTGTYIILLTDNTGRCKTVKFIKE